MNKKRRKEIEEQIKHLTDEEGNLTFYSNPNIDFLFGLQDCRQIPTKQDAFKPINVIQINDDGTEESVKNIYVKNDDSQAIRTFTNEIRKVASNVFINGHKITKPNLVEVVISISTLEKRFREVDVDNLGKCVLDGLNGIAFDDDSQVSTLLCQKFVHEMKINSILIGITKLTRERPGSVSNVKLFSSDDTWKIE